MEKADHFHMQCVISRCNHIIFGANNINTDEITVFIHNKQEETEETVEEVFLKNQKNPIFKGISGISAGKKFLFDLGLSLFVDYSLADMPPIK